MVSGYFSVLIDTTKKRNCSKTASLSCKFSKPVASFPGLPKFFEGLVPRLHGSRGLASSRDFRFWAQFIRKSVNHCVMQFPLTPLGRYLGLQKMKKCLLLSRSQKRSYASALGYSNTREG